MRIFLSWSGERSRQVAEKMRDWLPSLIQCLEPWVSSKDIEAGSRWSDGIVRQLNETRFGILCLTADNCDKPWLLFEAGALAKSVGDVAFVCPYLIDMTIRDLPQGPLSAFQAKLADESGTRDLVYSINKLLGDRSLTDERLSETFSKWWSDLRDVLVHPVPVPPAPPKRSTEDVLDELLGLVRGLPSSIGHLNASINQLRLSRIPSGPAGIRVARSKNVCAEVSPFGVGESVVHKVFGRGNVVLTRGRTVTVLFPGYGEKTVVESFLVPEQDLPY